MKMLYVLFIINFATFLVLLAFLPALGYEIPPEAEQYIESMNDSPTAYLTVISSSIFDALTSRENLRLILAAAAASIIAGYAVGVITGYVVPIILLTVVYNMIMAPTSLLLRIIGVSTSVTSIYFAVMNMLFLISLLSYVKGD